MKHFFKFPLRMAAVTILFVSLFGVTASAAQFVPYNTYTYDYDGRPVESPDAFVVKNRYTARDMDTEELSDASDLCLSQDGVFIADTGNNRIVSLDGNFKFKKDIRQFFNPEKLDPEKIGLEDDPSVEKFNAPEGVFVTKDSHLYVADTGNKRIVEFNEKLDLIRIIDDISSDILPEDFSFQPTKLVVDGSGRIYVLVKNVNMGVVELSADGLFVGFYGAQRVKQNVLDWMLNIFMTDDQRARQTRIVPRVNNNIAVDKDNFIWLTANSMDAFDRYSHLTGKDSTHAPVKRLNPNGDDVLVRNAHFAPGGDILNPPSSVVDVAVKANGVYSILDDSRNKIFTYDESGNLLYAFGGSGAQVGVFNLCGAIAYQDNDLLVLDKGYGIIVRYTPTPYSVLIEKALAADKERDFAGSREYWNQVLMQNNNFDQSYISIAKSYLRDGEYKPAMDYFKAARNVEGYSKAFREYRSDAVRRHFILIITVILLFLAGCILLFRWINKKNNETCTNEQKKKLGSQLFFAFYVIYHPFNGFWEIKREGRGGLAAAHCILGATMLTFIYKSMGMAYIFNNVSQGGTDMIQTVLNILAPVALWCIAGWSLTTLMSGEGSIKDIYIMTAYSLLPLIMIQLPLTVASNFMSLDEQPFIVFFTGLSFLWTVVLILLGSMVIHDYSFSKNLLTSVLSVVGMGVILFLIMLLLTLSQKIGAFFIDTYKELIFRA